MSGGLCRPGVADHRHCCCCRGRRYMLKMSDHVKKFNKRWFVLWPREAKEGKGWASQRAALPLCWESSEPASVATASPAHS